MGGEDRTKFVEPSIQTPTVDASDKVQSLCYDGVIESKNSLLTVNMDGMSELANNNLGYTVIHLIPLYFCRRPTC